jgi:hypothetical protein
VSNRLDVHRVDHQAHGIGGLVAWSGTDGPFSSPHLVSDPRYGRLHGLDLLLKSGRSPTGEPLRGADLGMVNPLQLGADIMTVHHPSPGRTSVGDGKNVGLKFSALCDADHT